MKPILISIALFLSVSFAFADSPLTSTSFAQAYSGSQTVQAASECGGTLTTELMKFLKSENSIALKMAVINAVSWNFEGQDNYTLYKNFLKNKMGNGKQKAENLLCLAYLKAMDNYFDCNEALKLADEALALNPGSYTFNIIHALIKAQALFDSDWCGVWMATDSVRRNTTLEIDMNAEAIRIIFEYMDLYQNECG